MNRYGSFHEDLLDIIFNDFIITPWTFQFGQSCVEVIPDTGIIEQDLVESMLDDMYPRSILPSMTRGNSSANSLYRTSPSTRKSLVMHRPIFHTIWTPNHSNGPRLPI